MLTLGSLFSGIGGLDLGLERAGMMVKWQVEIDPYCRRVLAKHWPDVERFEDVRQCGGYFSYGNYRRLHNLARVDVIAGGFPCQDISACNYRGQGLDGARSGLWSEFYRLICELRPSFAVIENVPALRFRGLDRVLCDLASCGFDAEWTTVSASQLGAPHARQRLFVVAYPPSERCETIEVFRRRSSETAGQEQAFRVLEWPGGTQSSGALHDRVRWVPDARVCRMVDGIPDSLDEYRALGNAVVPQVAEFIGRMIVESEK